MPIRSVAPVFALAIAAAATLIALGNDGHRGQAAPMSAGGYTTTATATPATVNAGGAVMISASVTSDAAALALVDIEVYAPDGTKTYQTFFDNQPFGVAQLRTFTATWQTSGASAAGTYSVKIGVFSPGWGTLFHWNGNAVSISVAGNAPTASATQGGGATATNTPAPSGGLPPLPAGWPSTLELGLASPPGGAGAMHAIAPYRFRYQYLAGGVNTGGGWATWNADGQFVTYYVNDSAANSVIPVFTYYQILQSLPATGSEADRVYNNMQNTWTMNAYYNDLKLFFQRAAGPNMAVLHVEPDLWGYLNQRATGDNAATVPASVASSAMPDVAAYADNVAGFAQAIDHLRDVYAPNVVLAYHMSVWGTGDDIVYSDPSDATVDAEAQRQGNFLNSLGGGFDIAFAEFSDRDAAFKQYIYGDGGAAWWNSGDYARNLRYLAKFVQVSGRRVVEWQVPQGNTKMRAMNNTWDHYQDNHAEWLLDDPGRTHLTQYLNAGVVGFLFGRGADGATCGCDAANDGVTDPAPINDNAGVSLNADDDGGFFQQKSVAYYAAGAMPLAGGGAPASTPTATSTRTPLPANTTVPATNTAIPPTATRTPTATPTTAIVPTATSSPQPAATTTPCRHRRKC